MPALGAAQRMGGAVIQDHLAEVGGWPLNEGAITAKVDALVAFVA